MKFKKTITILVFCIAVLSMVATASGIFLNSGPGNYEFESLHGETVTIYGKGLYRYEAVKMGPQARGQDVVTLFLGIPLLIISLYLSRKGSLKGRLLLTGTLSYFLYTYTQFTCIAYNQIFLVYVTLMALSLYAFILTMMSFDMKELSLSFDRKLPVKLLGGFQIFTALGLALNWLGDIISSLIKGTMPTALLHYTSIPVYSMDLGLVVPTFILSAILIIKRRPFGYLLSSIMIIKAFTMWIALTSMTVALAVEGEQMNFSEMAMAPFFSLVTIFFFILLLKNVKEPIQS